MKNWYWFATIGWSSAAVYNTIWAAKWKLGIIPESVTIFRLIPTQGKKQTMNKLDRAYNEFRDWLIRYEKKTGFTINLQTVKFAEENYGEYRDGFLKKIKKVPDDSKMIFDVTPGRKYASALGMAYGWIQKAEHIFYLHLLDSRYLNRPLPEIPIMEYELRDFARRKK